MESNHKHTVEAQMLIRKNVSEVFEAFIDPAITTKFWFTHANGKLEAGKTVTWQWKMYGVATEVHVKEINQNKNIKIEWGDPLTTVNFQFEEYDSGSTYVVIEHYGFKLSGDELINAIKDNTGGFTLVLAGLKAYLEHGIRLNLVADKYPKQNVD